jgi:hypothetical protein
MQKIIKNIWNAITPLWPLEQSIARNPLAGFEELPFEDAVKKATHLFQASSLPQQLKKLNRISIKYFKMFFDTQQAVLQMPGQENGLYHAFKELVPFDEQVQTSPKMSTFLKQLPDTSQAALHSCFEKLNLKNPKDQEQFTSLLLTSLVGWAQYTKHQSSKNDHNNLLTDYLAVRAIIAVAVQCNPEALLIWHQKEVQKAEKKALLTLGKIKQAEEKVIPKLSQLIKNIKNNKQASHSPEAQFIFCIDIRSEPLRRSIEKLGNYETFGGAGFFGLPVTFENDLNNIKKEAFPVILDSESTVSIEAVSEQTKKAKQGQKKFKKLQQSYQGIKYNFSSPLALAEATGFWLGLWMGFKTWLPTTAAWLKQYSSSFITAPITTQFNLKHFSIKQQAHYAGSFLKQIGLTKKFAPLVFLCGHTATVENNPAAASLDCGACGGNSGKDNAQLLATILNNETIRTELQIDGISIPAKTQFIAGLHTTTQNRLKLFSQNPAIENLQKQLNQLPHYDLKKSYSWSEVRPEWGLAKNTSFIIGPRNLTKSIDLQGRTFLHSYCPETDKDGSILTSIMNGPLIVGQWINAQYLFSTLDTSVYGTGNKITHNIFGKCGTMQGNSSDLFAGLSLQSVYQTDTKKYHEPVRLQVFITAPQERIDSIVEASKTLKMLVKNKWIKLSNI